MLLRTGIRKNHTRRNDYANIVHIRVIRSGSASHTNIYTMAGTARRRFPVKGTGRTFCAYIPGMRMAMGVNLIRVREVLSIPQPMESNATRLGDLEIDLDPNPRFCVAQYGSRTLESLSDTE